MQDHNKMKRKDASKNKILLEDVSHVILVSSGKGGVGKSTIAKALAEQLASQGSNVGIVDADIYGPSIPTMFGISAKPELDGNKMLPITKNGIKIMSIGFLVAPGSAIAWRGPMATKAVYQILSLVKWGNLDYLIIDTPPGTGDIHLSILENYKIDGTIIVTTPQKISAIDAIKAIDLYRKFAVPVIGIVENMSDIFLGNNGEILADSYSIPLIARVPMNIEVAKICDNGEPIGAMMPVLIPNIRTG